MDNGQAAQDPKQVAPAANGKGQAAKQVAPVANGSATPGQTAPGTGQTALALAGADVAVLLQTLGRVEAQMGRSEKQQALLLESQEGHYEDVEELEGTVEQAIEEGANILDNLEAGSQQARTMAENILAVANAAKNTVLVLLALGGHGLVLWALSWKAFAEASTNASSPTPTPEDPAPAKAPSPVPAPAQAPAKGGLQKME